MSSRDLHGRKTQVQKSRDDASPKLGHAHARNARGGRVLGAALICLALTSSLGACASESTSTTSTTTASSTTSDTTTQVTSQTGSTEASGLDVTDMFTDRDLAGTYDATGATTIELSGSSASVSGSGATVDGTTVTITTEGTYVVSGTLTDGQIVVAATDSDKVQIVLDGVTITNSELPAILVTQADKVFVTLAEGSTNSLTTTGTVTQADDADADAVIFSHDDLTVNGTGSLDVTTAGGHGIVSNDDLVVAGVNLTVDASGSCLRANNSVRVASGTLSLTSGDDGIHADTSDDAAGYVYVADGSITINAGDDGIHAEGATLVAGGTINIERSYEGLEGQTVTIAGGDVTVVSSDDGINAASSDATGDSSAEQLAAGNVASSDASSAAGSMGGQQGGPMQDSHAAMGADSGTVMDTDESCVVTITGGTINITADGDGIDSNGSISVEGGVTYVFGPESSGNGSLDYGTSATITGGTFLAAGSTGMAVNFGNDSTQCAALVSLSGSAGDTITLSDESGATLLQVTTDKSYGCVVVSCADMQTGSTYTVSNGSSETSVTMDSTVESASGTGTGGMGGGMGTGGMGRG